MRHLVSDLHCPHCEGTLRSALKGPAFKGSILVEPDRGGMSGKMIMPVKCVDCYRWFKLWVCQSPLDVVLWWERDEP